MSRSIRGMRRDRRRGCMARERGRRRGGWRIRARLWVGGVRWSMGVGGGCIWGSMDRVSMGVSIVSRVGVLGRRGRGRSRMWRVRWGVSNSSSSSRGRVKGGMRHRGILGRGVSRTMRGGHVPFSLVVPLPMYSYALVPSSFACPPPFKTSLSFSLLRQFFTSSLRPTHLHSTDSTRSTLTNTPSLLCTRVDG